MKVITPPDRHETNPFSWPSLFLAGGISNCPDWPTEILALIKDTPLTVFNPRRLVMSDELIQEQIRWEYEYLRFVDIISFWFPKETLCPITLYELGAWLMRRELWLKNLIQVPHHVPQILIGVHPEYARKFDIEEQLACIDKDCDEKYRIKLVYSIPDLATQIIERAKMTQEFEGLFKYRIL